MALGDAGVEAIRATQPDLVILDLMLPGMNGLDVCRHVRDTYSGAILMLTASQSEADHVAGLELGADDFVTKPIQPRVLLARIRTQLRRLKVDPAPIKGVQDGVINVGTLEVNLRSRSVHATGHRVPLTTMEFDILAMLAKEAGAVVKRDDLYRSVIGTEYDGIDRGLDVHVSRIRRKLGAPVSTPADSHPCAPSATCWQANEAFRITTCLRQRTWVLGDWTCRIAAIRKKPSMDRGKKSDVMGCSWLTTS